MFMKKILILALSLSLFLAVFSFTILAESGEEQDGFDFATYIDFETYEQNSSGQVSPPSLKIGDTFNVIVGIKNITNETGFIGINLRVDYDPAVLSVVFEANPDVSGEENESPVSFGTVNLPEIWEGSPYVGQNVVLDSDGNEIGTAVIIATADLETPDLENQGFTSDEFYVIIPFKCLAATNSTVIKIDTDGDLSCTQLTKSASAYGVLDCPGKGSALTINGIAGDAPAKEPASNLLLYILAIAGGVVVVGGLFAFAVLKKKKNS